MKSPHIKAPSSFDTAALVGRGRSVAARGGGAGQHEQLVKQTEKWVAQTFYGTLLKQMRDSPFHSDLMDGGNGGKTFASLLDQRLADHMSHHAGGKLTRAIVKKIEANQAAQKYAKASKLNQATAHHSQTSSKHASSVNTDPRSLTPEARTLNPQKLRRLHVHMTREHA